ncbi:Tn3 family transposase [Shewanella psychropiezotolerans]|uniref:Tn3 family transposase n=2 Tax=Shewanella psychropiezotolerans TaxID=2593655 RepID=A0ABX5WY94_9GAMM|nr:Tn3 family transposase [Shewanella psychropiezotolerans]
MAWIAFGGTVIKSGDPAEQSKRMKYMDVVTNAIMLQNVADLTEVLHTMSKDGFTITTELVSSLSPYIRGHILRFGQWALNMEDPPSPLEPKPVPVSV